MTKEEQESLIDAIMACACVGSPFDEAAQKSAPEMPTDKLQDMIDSLDNRSE